MLSERKFLLLERKILLSVLSSLTLIGGCGGSGGSGDANPGSTTNPAADNPIQQGAEKIAVAIKSFESEDPCTELNVYLADYGETIMRQRLIAARDAQYDYSQLPGPPSVLAGTGNQVAAPGSPASGTTAPSSGAQDGTTAGSTTPSNDRFTTTNLQTAGIDELDDAKNNARHLFRLHRENDRTILSKARYWPANDLALIGKVAMPAHSETPGNGLTAWVRGMFVTENETAVVFSTLDGGAYILNPAATSNTAAPAGVPASASLAADLICPLSGCYSGPRIQKSYIDLFDASVSSNPVLQHTVEIGGSLLDARRRGDRVWVLTQESFRFPENVLWSPKDFNYSAAVAVRKAAYDQLIEQNRALIRAADVKQWLPEDLARSAGNVDRSGEAGLPLGQEGQRGQRTELAQSR